MQSRKERPTACLLPPQLVDIMHTQCHQVQSIERPVAETAVPTPFQAGAGIDGSGIILTVLVLIVLPLSILTVDVLDELGFDKLNVDVPGSVLTKL